MRRSMKQPIRSVSEWLGSGHRSSGSGGRVPWISGTAFLTASVIAVTLIGVVGAHSHGASNGSKPPNAPQTSAQQSPQAGTSSSGSRAVQKAHVRNRLQRSPAFQHRTPSQRSARSASSTESAAGGPVEHVIIPKSGSKHFRRSHSGAKPRSKHGELITYNVRVERDVPYQVRDVAAFIHRVLNDRRSWGGHGHWRLQRVSAGHKADITIYLVTPKTTDKLCDPLKTKGKVSCFNEGRVTLNAKRWADGSKSYRDDVVNYRRNLINHEVGHALGHGHVKCPGKNKKAPIMMQQTKGLHGCRANPWPYP